jgi:hypothetical protein
VRLLPRASKSFYRVVYCHFWHMSILSVPEYVKKTR